MSLTTEEMLEIGLNRLIYAAEQISRHFTKGGELFATLNIDYPFNESFDDVLTALLQWRDSACNKQTHLLPSRISLKESNLQHAARNVLMNWEGGDLAGAACCLVKSSVCGGDLSGIRAGRRSEVFER
jgi:hypothetical protein